MMANRDITKLNLYHELLANRYLLSVLLTNVLATQTMMAEIISEFKKEERKKETKEKVSHTLLKERKEKKKEERTSAVRVKRQTVGEIEFNSFTLSSNKFEALLREYDHDVVTDACVVLDKLIAINGKSYKDIPRKLEELCKQLSKRERLIETLDATARGLREVDVELIDNEVDAKKYIFATPKYLRNVDKGCQYLVAKFNLDIEKVPSLG